jgi:hypothetical protein
MRAKIIGAPHLVQNCCLGSIVSSGGFSELYCSLVRLKKSGPDSSVLRGARYIRPLPSHYIVTKDRMLSDKLSPNHEQSLAASQQGSGNGENFTRCMIWTLRHRNSGI